MAEKRNVGGVTSPPLRKLRKLSAKPAIAQLSIESIIAQLKSESLSIKRSGVSQYITDEQAVTPELKSLLLPYLSSKTVVKYKDVVGADHVEHNKKVYEKFNSEFPKLADTECGAFSTNVGAEVALNLYCNLIENLRIGNSASDGSPVIYLEKASGNDADKDARAAAKATMPGGFSSDYDSVAVETYSKDMQNRCVFGFDRAAKFGKECTTFAAKLNSKVNEFLEDVFPDKVLHNTGVHVLFNWNAHSLFSYHRDAGSDITCIINLSPAKSTFHVAGFEPEAT